MNEILDFNDIKRIVSDLAKKYGVEKISLFGSYAKGTATENSDVDLLIVKGKICGLIQLAGFKLALEDKLGAEVDMVTIDSLDKKFLENIEKEEVLLYAV